MAVRCTLGKGERLVREQHIETLFRKGEAFSVFPLRVIYRLEPMPADETFTIRAGFSVAKKKFKRAVDRNRIKRLMRESWRLQKHTLIPAIPEESQLHLFLIYTGQELPEYPVVYNAVTKAIPKLQQRLSPAGSELSPSKKPTSIDNLNH